MGAAGDAQARAAVPREVSALGRVRGFFGVAVYCVQCLGREMTAAFSFSARTEKINGKGIGGVRRASVARGWMYVVRFRDVSGCMLLHAGVSCVRVRLCSA